MFLMVIMSGWNQGSQAQVHMFEFDDSTRVGVVIDSDTIDDFYDKG
jgi:hypothetical protein